MEPLFIQPYQLDYTIAHKTSWEERHPLRRDTLSNYELVETMQKRNSLLDDTIDVQPFSL